MTVDLAWSNSNRLPTFVVPLSTTEARRRIEFKRRWGRATVTWAELALCPYFLRQYSLKDLSMPPRSCRSFLILR
jgi:hypothetical protein